MREAVNTIKKIIKKEEKNMTFNPLIASENITETFRKYILATFGTNNQNYNKDLEKAIFSNDAISKGPYLQITHNYPKSKTVKEFVDEGLLEQGFNDLDYPKFNNKLFDHQESAIRKTVVEDRNIVVSTGTGSGKTFSFLIPILNHIMKVKKLESKNGKSSGVKAMLLYPLNALANDQINTLREMIGVFEKGESDNDITFGSFTGETKDTEAQARESLNEPEKIPRNEVISRERFRKSPPDILITNYAMLEHLLIKPENNSLFGVQGDNGWKYIVLDEAHTYNGAKGSEVAMLLRRLTTALDNDCIRFILTSATLGSEEQNKEVAAFASELCSSSFEESDVIRSNRIPFERPAELTFRDMDFYRSVSDIVNNPDVKDVESSLKGILDEADDNKTLNVRERLYDIISHDPVIYRITDSLDERPKTVEELSEELSLSSDDLISIISASTSAMKNGMKLFDSKYHLFVKGLDGAYVTLAPDYSLFIKPKKEHFVGSDSYKVFQISTCYNCKATYLLGDEKNGKFTQVARNSEDYRGYKSYVLAEGEFEGEPTNFDEEESRLLCSKCGMISYVEGDRSCDCGEIYLNKIIKISDKEKVSVCPVCKNSNTKRGLLRQLYLGQDASTSVIASSLYEDLIKGKDDRFLSFSDSRQSAAFFSAYLSDTYRGILMKRVIFEAMKNYTDLFMKGIPYEEAVTLLGNISNTNGLHFPKNDLVEGLRRECSCNNSYRSMEYMGFLRFEAGRITNGNDFVPFEKNAFGLDTDTFYNLVNSVLKHIRDNRAVCNTDGSLKKYEYRYGYTTDTKNTNRIKPLLNKRMNSYLLSVFDGNEDLVERFVLSTFNHFLEYDNSESCSFLNLDSLNVIIPEHYYRCSSCKKNFPFSVKGICPRCVTSTLERFETDVMRIIREEKNGTLDISGLDHYTRQVIKSPLKHLRIAEHTAQLNIDAARETQNSFKEGRLNALSCSTTFEMGVDIGDLNTVLMRNVPPSSANYIQRAGRAGRGPDSSAFAVTFCREMSHDVSFFNNPLDMINGQIPVPKIKADNPNIAIRHMFASALRYFWVENGYSSYPKKTPEFIDSYGEFQRYMESEPETLKKYLCKVLPNPLDSPLAEDDTKLDPNNFAWTEHLFNEKYGRMRMAVEEFKEDCEHMEESFTRIQQSDSKISSGDRRKLLRSASKADRVLSTFEHTETLDFLSSHNIIPKYGFPVDTVELVPVSSYPKKYNLSRNALIGISDYAPGSEVMVDGNKLTSKFVKKMYGRGWPIYKFRKCGHCRKISVKLDNFIDDEGDLDVCSCGEKLHGEERFIKPEFGFMYNPNDNKTNVSEKPVKSYSSDISLSEKYSRETDIITVDNESLQLISRENGRLTAINDTKFMICEVCGFGKIQNEGVRDTKHENERGVECKNKFLRPLSLGHIFKTDIVMLRFITTPCTDFETAVSVLQALQEGFCRTFGIDNKEVSGCLDNTDNEYTFIIFDNTPGGSGYVKALHNEESLKKVLTFSLNMMEQCTCGGADGNHSCYSCLRTYANQRYHDILDRSKAIAYLKSLEVKL
jgi:superfamily II DNA/RNA helicase